MKHKGLTLIEILIYIAIVAAFMSAIILFLFNAFLNKLKNDIQNEVTENAYQVINKLNYELSNAEAVSLSNSSTLIIDSLDNTRGNAVLRLSNGRVQYGYGSSGLCSYNSPCNLTSNLITVQSLSFIITQGNGVPIVKYSISLKNLGNNVRATYSDTFSGSIIVHK